MAISWRRHLWLLAGAVALVIGYVLLASGDITAAPLLLVAGYCVFIPLHLLRAFRQGSDRSGE